jgi:hypothetical protein
MIPDPEKVERAQMDHIKALAEWMRKQYGYTSKSDLIQQISEITLNNVKMTRSEYRAFLLRLFGRSDILSSSFSACLRTMPI